MSKKGDEFIAFLSKGVDRKRILADIDLSTATHEEIDRLYDQALAEALEERRSVFAAASSEDLMKRPTI